MEKKLTPFGRFLAVHMRRSGLTRAEFVEEMGACGYTELTEDEVADLLYDPRPHLYRTFHRIAAGVLDLDRQGKEELLRAWDATTGNPKGPGRER